MHLEEAFEDKLELKEIKNARYITQISVIKTKKKNYVVKDIHLMT